MPVTHWSQILGAGQAVEPHRNQYLADLLKRYWKPVYHYVRAIRRHASAEDAEDLTQGFFEMLLTRVDFSKLSPERGSFRGFLKTAIHRFVTSDERTKAVRIRLEKAAQFPFDQAEALFRQQDDLTPEEIFDRSWAREVTAVGLTKLRNELAAGGKTTYFEIFRRYCLEPNDAVTYESLAAEYNIKVHDVQNYLVFVRNRGSEIFSELLQEYILPGESLDEELRLIFSD